MMSCLWTVNWQHWERLMLLFHQEFQFHWCQLANQAVFPPAWSRIIVFKDASSTEGIAQCTREVKSNIKVADCINNLWAFVWFCRYLFDLPFSIVFSLAALCFLSKRRTHPLLLSRFAVEKTSYLLVPVGNQVFRLQTKVFFLYYVLLDMFK